MSLAIKKKKKKNVSDIYITKDFSATYQLPSLCLSTSSEVVALKGWGEELQRLLENELCCEEGISWREREKMPWHYPQNSSPNIKSY